MCQMLQEPPVAGAGVSRRSLLAATVGGLGLGALGGLRPRPARADGTLWRRRVGTSSSTTLILLGTAGGPAWYPGSDRAGISSALLVGGKLYLVDAGEGVGPRLRDLELTPVPPFGNLQNVASLLRGLFFTHLHSDHVIDYPNLLLFGWFSGLEGVDRPLQVFGPGRRGSLPPIFGTPPEPPPVVAPENPTPGTVDMTERLLEAFALDVNDRLRDQGKGDLRGLVQANDIELPPGVGADANTRPAPPMEPFEVFTDERVRVTATLVYHPPVFPSFAYRFDTDAGSVVFSGDTGRTANLVRLAQGADVLVHEVIDANAITARFPQPLPPPLEALRNHLVEAHTTIEQVGAVAEEAGVATLVLNHFVPATVPRHRWAQAARSYSGTLVVGEDLLHLGVTGSQTGRPRPAPTPVPS